MKLLMITQKIDRDDDILGVYHEWAREISKSFDRVDVSVGDLGQRLSQAGEGVGEGLK